MATIPQKIYSHIVTNFSSEVQKDILCTLHEKRPEAFEIARISEPQDGYEFHVKIRKPSIYLSSKAQWIYALHLKIKHSESNHWIND